jgi:DNA-binding IclR family transcriptional regulator
MHVHHNTYELLEELARLVDANPAEVSEVLRKLIETGDLTYDYEDRLRTLVKRLAALGRRADALEYCDRLRNVPGMFQLFQELNAAGP